MSFEHNSVRKNLFLTACIFWDSGLSLREVEKNLNLLETMVMETRTWSFYFGISKYLDYTQCYMMLLEQCGHIVAKVEVTVT